MKTLIFRYAKEKARFFNASYKIFSFFVGQKLMLMKYFSTRKLFIILFTLILSCGAYAQGDPPGRAGARAGALGNAYIGVRGDFWGLFYNPASIAGTPFTTISAYGEQRFLLSELTSGSAGIVWPFLPEQSIGVAVSTFGFDAFRRSVASASYGIEVIERLSLGASVSYMNIDLGELGSTNAVLANVGINTALTDQLSLGFTAYNITRTQLENTFGIQEDLPVVYAAGLAYQPDEKVLLVVDLVKDVDQLVSFRGGIEYRLASILNVRAGVGNEPIIWSGGIGLNLNQLQLDFAAQYHEQLGYTPQVSLSFAFGSSESSE